METAAEKKTTTKTAAAKVYKLRSANKFLTVSAMNVQFIGGKYKTTDPAVVRALLTINGVELEEE